MCDQGLAYFQAMGGLDGRQLRFYLRVYPFILVIDDEVELAYTLPRLAEPFKVLFDFLDDSSGTLPEIFRSKDLIIGSYFRIEAVVFSVTEPALRLDGTKVSVLVLHDLHKQIF